MSQDRRDVRSMLEAITWHMKDWGIETPDAAGRVARSMRALRGYSWVGIYQLVNGELELLNHGAPPAPIPLLTRATLDEQPNATVADYRMWAAAMYEGKLVGAIDVLSERPLRPGDLGFLQLTAQAIWYIYGH